MNKLIEVKRVRDELWFHFNEVLSLAPLEENEMPMSYDELLIHMLIILFNKLPFAPFFPMYAAAVTP